MERIIRVLSELEKISGSVYQEYRHTRYLQSEGRGSVPDPPASLNSALRILRRCLSLTSIAQKSVSVMAERVEKLSAPCASKAGMYLAKFKSCKKLTTVTSILTSGEFPLSS